MEATFKDLLKRDEFELPNGAILYIHELSMGEFQRVMDAYGGDKKDNWAGNVEWVLCGCDSFDPDNEAHRKTVLSLPYKLVILIADAISELSGMQESAEERKKNLKAIT